MNSTTLEAAVLDGGIDAVSDTVAGINTYAGIDSVVGIHAGVDSIGGYDVPMDPMDLMQCDSCQ